MKLPFTTQQFLEVFKKYNTAVYPVQLLLVLLATIVILFVFRKQKNKWQNRLGYSVSILALDGNYIPYQLFLSHQ